MTDPKQFNIGHLTPMHRRGASTLKTSRQEVPERPVSCAIGSRFSLSA